MNWLYRVQDGGGYVVEHTTWSDVFECLSCGKEMVYWEAGRNKKTGAIDDQVHCPHCGNATSSAT
ncbi:MAG: hypothetical protein LC118_09455 [Dehalococcoidia bacterium]|nr:hypothetical protein [Dehalococcoidia bacterium]